MQDEDRDLTLRAPLVVLVRRIHLDETRPEPALLIAPRLLCPDPQRPLSYLDPGFRVGFQVPIPVRVFRSTAHRGNDDQVLAVIEVQERGRPLTSGPAPGRVLSRLLRAAEPEEGPEGEDEDQG
jgi:hypothetical protein